VYSSCFLQSSTVSTQVPALSLGTARDPIRYVAVDAAVVHAVWPHSKITRWRVFTREDARRCRPVFLSYNLIVVLDRGIPQWWLIASLMQLQATSVHMQDICHVISRSMKDDAFRKSWTSMTHIAYFSVAIDLSAAASRSHSRRCHVVSSNARMRLVENDSRND